MTPTELRDKLRGPIVAMTTIFKDDYTLDLDGIHRLTEFYVEQGILTVIVAGSTGEFFSLSDEERKRVIRAVVQAADGRLTVIAGTAHSGTQLTIDLTKFAQDNGADGAMVTPPYYRNDGFEGLQRHYDLVTKATDIGIVIYFSGAVLPKVADILAKPELMLPLIESGNGHVAGFKDASGNFAFYRDVSLLLRGQVAVMGSGGMNYFLYGQRFGSSCCLTGLGNIWPKWELEFCEALDKGDFSTADRIVTEKDLPYLKATTATGRYWACLKALQEMSGLPGGKMRPPLLDCTVDQREQLRAACTEIGLLQPSAAAV